MARARQSQFQAFTFGRRKRKIIDASLTVFQEQGCFGFRVEDVATRAGIAKGSVYAHFESRTEILESAFAQMEIELLEEYRRRVAGFPADATFASRLALLAEILLSRDTGGRSNFVAMLRRLPCALENSGRSVDSRIITELIAPLIEEGQRCGALGSSIPSLDLAHMFLSIVTCSVMQHKAPGGYANSGQIPGVVTDFFIRGASPSSGKRLLPLTVSAMKE